MPRSIFHNITLTASGSVAFPEKKSMQSFAAQKYGWNSTTYDYILQPKVTFCFKKSHTFHSYLKTFRRIPEISATNFDDKNTKQKIEFTYWKWFDNTSEMIQYGHMVFMKLTNRKLLKIVSDFPENFILDLSFILRIVISIATRDPPSIRLSSPEVHQVKNSELDRKR